MFEFANASILISSLLTLINLNLFRLQRVSMPLTLQRNLPAGNKESSFTPISKRAWLPGDVVTISSVAVSGRPILDYMEYYPLYNVRSLISVSSIPKYDSYLSGNTHDIENEKYGNLHLLSLHPIITSSGAAKKANGLFFGGISR